MNDKDKLAELFRKFPGIGPRQAKRMVYHLLTEDKNTIYDLSKLIGNLKDKISICSLCFRYYEKTNLNAEKNICPTCLNPNRNQEIIMIVSRDVDYESIEKSGVYKGMYFVLGGTIPFLSKNPHEVVRVKELFKIMPLRIKNGLKEIIFALNANPEGENTTAIIEKKLKEFLQTVETENPANLIIISKLGRGFSTGTEVEYSDKETLKNAISSRSLS